MLRRVIAISLLCTMARPAIGAVIQPIPLLRVELPEPPPAMVAKIIWKVADQEWVGYWFHAEEVRNIELKLTTLQSENAYLADKAAKECFDASVKATTNELGKMPSLWLVGGLGVVAGAVLGIFVYKKVR